MESDGEKGFDPFANDPNLEVYYFLMFCSIRTYLQIIRKTHLVCILLIILSIFKVQLDFPSKEVKQLYSWCTKQMFLIHSLLDAYKNSYLKYLQKSFLFRLWFIQKTGKHKGKTAYHRRVYRKSGCGSTVSFMPFNAKKVLNSNNIDKPSTVNWGTTCAVSYDHQL